MKPLLDITNLSTWYPIRKGVLARIQGHVQALTNVDLVVGEGETVAVVGESGCGKSTLGRTIVGLERAKSGRITFRGVELLDHGTPRAKNLRKDIQIVFQDPASSLNPRMTVLDQISEGMIEDGLLRGPADEAAAALLQKVGIDASALPRFPMEFSGGQRQRIAIARALSVHPSLLICDEAVSSLDVSIQAQVIKLLMDLKNEYGLSYLFITHDLRVVRRIADRVAVMYLGRIVEEGSADSVMSNPRHPYTQALLSAAPVPGGERRKRIVLAGDVPSAVNPPSGCPFHTRCAHVMDVCCSTMPPKKTVEGREVSCHLYPG